VKFFKLLDSIVFIFVSFRAIIVQNHKLSSFVVHLGQFHIVSFIVWLTFLHLQRYFRIVLRL